MTCIVVPRLPFSPLSISVSIAHSMYVLILTSEVKLEIYNQCYFKAHGLQS